MNLAEEDTSGLSTEQAADEEDLNLVCEGDIDCWMTKDVVDDHDGGWREEELVNSGADVGWKVQDG